MNFSDYFIYKRFFLEIAKPTSNNLQLFHISSGFRHFILLGRFDYQILLDSEIQFLTFLGYFILQNKYAVEP